MRPHPAHLTASLLAVVLATLASPSLAAWPHDPHSGNVPLSNFASLQVYPRMFTDGVGGAFVAWHELRSSYDLYAQRINASGTVTWGGAGVAVCSATGDQANAALCSDGAGGVIIAWHDARSGNWNIYVQRLNAAGVPQWTANGVAICTATGDQQDPQIVSDGAGGAILTWADPRLVEGSVDIYAQRVNASGVPQWLGNGVNICNAANGQVNPVIASDGAAGAIIAWVDFRSGTADIYAQRLNAAGTSLWAGNGVPVCMSPSDQNELCLVADGTGGAIASWTDRRNGNPDIYSQRLAANGVGLWLSDGKVVAGTLDSEDGPVIASDGSGGAIVAWKFRDNLFFNDLQAQRMSANGVAQWPGARAICLGFDNQTTPCISADGNGGAVIGWMDARSSQYDIYAQRISGDGTIRWATDGRPVSSASLTQQAPSLVPDGAGGAILSWFDDRFVAGSQRVYAQRVERFGELGSPEATLTSVRDTPNDQGGQVKVSWSASYLDVDPTYGIAEYRLWRSAPQRFASSLALEADLVTTDSDEAAVTGKLLVLPNATTAYAWELVATQPAAILPSYSLITATTSDSVSGSNPRTAFMIEALAGESLQSPRWFSPPDSGYSVDNLPPATPAPFSGVTAPGSHDLDWGANAEADLAGYRLYRGVTADFVPGPVTLLSEQAGVGYLDATDYSYFYKLSAVDAHGNESGFASFAAQGSTTGVGDAGLPMSLRLASPEPNPARASVHIDFHLPRAAHVVLAVYDAGGRMVRALVRGERAAGRTGTTWDLRDDAGRDVPSGIYFIRLEAAGRNFTRRMVAIR